MITIIDYHVGNLKSVEKAFAHLGYEAILSSDPKTIANTDLLVLPGVGAFEEGIKNLNKLGLSPLIKNHIAQNKPFLGICLGFQLLFESSEEHGNNQGLGIFKGQVKNFANRIPADLKIPHMGWNNLNIIQDDANLFQSSPVSVRAHSRSPLTIIPYVYFVHSYYVESPEKNLVCTTTNYGIDFISSIQRGNLLGTQFHPEKSGDVGLNILKNYLGKFYDKK
jgi:glutamine amidotransferase